MTQPAESAPPPATDEDRREARDFARRVSLFYFAAFGLNGFHLPYFPIWLEDRGMSVGQIATILALPVIARAFFSPVIGFIADRVGEHRRVLQVLCVGSFLALIAMTFADGFGAILAMAVLFAMFWMTVPALTETVALDGVRRAGLDYGRIRAWGSVSFVIANFMGGYAILWYGPGVVLPLLIGDAVFTVIVALLLPTPRGLGRLKAATTAPRIRFADAVALMRSKTFLVFLFTTAVLQSSHGLLYAFGSIHWKALGYTTTSVGFLWATAVVAEVVLFLLATRIVKRFGIAPMLGLSMLASIARWMLFGFDPPIALQFVGQAMHALTFGVAHLAAMEFLSNSIPRHMSATAQGLYAAVIGGIATGSVMAASGPLYGALAGHAFFVMAVFAATSAVGVWYLGRTPSRDLPVVA